MSSNDEIELIAEMERTPMSEEEKEARMVVCDFFRQYLNHVVRTFNLITTGTPSTAMWIMDDDTALAAYAAPAKWLRIALYGAGLAEDDAEAIKELSIEMLEAIFLLPGFPYPDIPQSWYETRIGFLVAKAQVRALGDELITIADASRISGLSIQAIAQRIKSGKLDAYTDERAASRQGRRLVRRSAFQPQENHE